MAHTRATRHILSDRVLQPRRNYEEIGSIFRLNTALISSKTELDANFSAKALNEAQTGGGKESEKRTSGGVAERIPELRYAPNAKKKPGQVLKLHVSAKDTLKSSDKPNFGWVDPPTPTTPSQQKRLMDEAMAWKKRRPKVRIRTYDIDPRTGGRLEGSEQEVSVKGLGRSLGRMVPGGNLASRAASAIGVITDENGKFRCPPGTPAANQFTDEFGTNCFVPPVSSLRALGRMRGWFNNYAAAGRLAQQMDRDPEDDPEFQANRRAMAAASEMLAPRHVFDQRKKDTEDAIKSLQAMVGATTDTDNNAHLWDTLSKLKETDRWDVDFSELFTGITGGESLWDDSKSLQENLDNMRQVIQSQYREWTGGDDDAALELAKRHEEVMGGFLEGVLQEFYEGSESVGQIRRLQFRPRGPEETIDDFWSTDGEMVPNAFDPNTGFGLTMQFNPTAMTLRPIIENGSFREMTDGKYVVVDTDAIGSEPEQWAEIASMMRGQIDLERWRDVFATDLSTARHESIRAAGRHLAFHETGHAHQYLAARKAILDHHKSVGHMVLIDRDGNAVRVTDPPDQWTNEMWHGALNQMMKGELPDGHVPQGFPPVGIHAFEGSMLHILSGRYYQELVQTYWGPDGRGPQDRSIAAVALMEGLTELRALKKMGVIDSDLVDEFTGWMDGPDKPGVITRPPTPPRVDPPGAPDVNPPNSPPTPDSEKNVGVIPHGIAWGIDAETGEVFPSQEPFAMMERYFISRFGGRPDDKRGGSQEIPRQAIARQWGWPDTSYAQMSPETLDKRFEKLRDDAEAIMSRIRGGEEVSLDDRTRLWLATKGMAQISDENARRINASDAQRADRDSRFQRNEPGKYFRSGGKKPYKRNQREGVDEIWDETELREEMRKLENAIPQLYPDVPRWTTDPDGYGAEQSQKARRKMTRRERDAMSKSLEDLNTGAVFGGASLEELLKTHANRTAAGKPSRSPSETVTEDVLPLLDAMDSNVLEEAVEATILLDDPDTMLHPLLDPSFDRRPLVRPYGQNYDPKSADLYKKTGVFEGVLSTPESKSDLDFDGGSSAGGLKSARVYLPAGSKGLFRENEDSGEMTSIILPPGDLKLIDGDNGDIPIFTPARQESAADYADRILRDLDAMGPATSLSERRERDRLKAVLEPRRKPSGQARLSPHSDDPAVRHRMESKRNALSKRFRDSKIEPFNINRSPSKRPDELDVDKTFDNGVAAARRGLSSNGETIDFTPEARDYIDRYGPDAASNVVGEAAQTWHDAIDKRPRVHMTADEFDEMAYTGLFPHPSNGQTAEVAQNFGWSDISPNESLPVFGTMAHANHDDKLDMLLAELDVPGKGFPARRRREFLNAGDRNPAGDRSLFGNIEMVLRPEVSHRTGYGLGDITHRVGMPVLVNEKNGDDIMRGLVSAKRNGRANSFESGKNFANLLNAGVSGNYDGMQHRSMKDGPLDAPDYAIESAIAGGFDFEEVEGIIIPVESLGSIGGLRSSRMFDSSQDWETTLSKSSGWAPEEIEFLKTALLDGTFDKVEAANLLRQHITAADNKAMWDRMGMNVRYTNKNGIDLFNKGDLTAFSDSGARIGRVRSPEEALRIRVGDEIMSRQQELRPAVQQGMKSIRRRAQEMLGERVTSEATSRIGGLGRRIRQREVPHSGVQAVGSRLLNSDQAERLFRRAGLDSNDIDNIRFVGEMAAAFGTSGPAGVGLVLARRGSREAIELGVQKAVEQGWLTDTQARRIMRAADTVAPEGLPDEITAAIGDTARDVWDSAAADKARALGEAAAQRVRELDIVDRGMDVFDSARDRILGRGSEPDTPALPASSGTWDPFGGMASRRGSIRSEVPALRGENPEQLRRLGLDMSHNPDSIDQTYYQNIVDIAGDIRLPDPWGEGQGKTIRESFTQTNYKDETYFSSYSGDLDYAIEAVQASDLSDEDKARVVEDLQTVKGLSQLAGVGMSTSKPPGRSRDPFGDDGPEAEFVPPTAEQLDQQIDEIFDSMPESFFENFGSVLADFQKRKETRERREKTQREVESELTRSEARIGYFRLLDENDVLDRTAPVGEATVARPHNPDHEPSVPDPDTLRSIDDLVQLSKDGMVVADSLLKPEHREELRKLLLENPRVKAALDLIRERVASGGYLDDDDIEVETRSGAYYAGRELVDALVHARGMDAAATLLTDDEIDVLRYVDGWTPVSRGGNPEMARRHIEGDGYPIGEGVDGAGVYFAVQGGTERMGINEHFDAAVYAGENGAVMQGVVSPSARFAGPNAIATQREAYRLEVQAGIPQNYSEGANPLLDLRRELVASGDTEMVEALDLMVGTASSDNNGEFPNGSAVIALLQGYDGLASYGSNSADNRVILYNRSAVLLSSNLLSADQYNELKPWEKLEVRAKALAEAHNLPVGLEGAERTEWILQETERRLGELG